MLLPHAVNLKYLYVFSNNRVHLCTIIWCQQLTHHTKEMEGTGLIAGKQDFDYSVLRP